MLNTDIIDTTCIDNISLNTSSMCMCNRNVVETIYGNRHRTATALSDHTYNDYDLFKNSSHYQCDNNLYLASDRNKFRARYNINIPLITTAKKSYLIEQRKGEKDTMDSNQIKNKIYEFAKLKLLNKFHTSAIINISSDRNMKIFLKWLSKYDKYWRHRVTKNKSFYAFIDMDIFIVIDKNTLCRIRTNDYIKKDMTEYDMLHNNYMIDSYTIKVDLYGKHCFTIIKFLKTLSYIDKLSCYKIVYNAGNSGYGSRNQTEIYYSCLLPRSKDTVFLDYTNMDGIFLHINKFLSNKEKYHARDLLFKTGILLYGPPGTGKSTVARMICSEYKMSMVLIDMSQFSNIDIDYITTSINADDNMYVIVLEDIDRVMDAKDSDKHEAVNKLLQFLDSSSSPTDVIFVATTNHLDRLDPAIIRDGRFDATFNIEDIHKDAAFRMMYSFGLNIDACMEIWKNNNVDGLINPARLQNLILNYQGEKEIDLQEE